LSTVGQSVLFVVTEDWYFVSHRLAMARILQRAGWQVTLAARFSGHEASLEAEGVRCIPIRLRRRASSALDEVHAIRELRALYRRERPTIVHHVALKPVIFGGLAALGVKGLTVVNAVAGLGFLFSSSSSRARIGRQLAVPLLRQLFSRENAWAIVQHPEDEEALRRLGVGRPGHVVLIRGAGVDTTAFRALPEAPGVPMVLFAGRMLRDKGVADFVEAARLLRDQGIAAQFELVGAPDGENPGSHTIAELEGWHREGVVNWRGHSSTMPEVLAAAHVVCLPTAYGEGVPKILIEAAASGRAIVATDWPGCREVVRNGVNGLLVPPRDAAALARDIARIISDPALRERMGAAGTRLAAEEFSVEAVTAATLALYQRARA
jgi:glycosyltransferase involved in cell wall biosynthesis